MDILQRFCGEIHDRFGKILYVQGKFLTEKFAVKFRAVELPPFR
jgi:hypothetical protein